MSNPEDFSIEELQEILEAKIKELEEESPLSDEGTSVKEDFTVSRNLENTKMKRPVKAGVNTWVDTGENKDVTTPDIELTPRKRPKPTTIKKRCHVCGKDFEISTKLVSGNFMRCNECTGR